MKTPTVKIMLQNPLLTPSKAEDMALVVIPPAHKVVPNPLYPNFAAGPAK
jgi:hypothetical protein